MVKTKSRCESSGEYAMQCGCTSVHSSSTKCSYKHCKGGNLLQTHMDFVMDSLRSN